MRYSFLLIRLAISLKLKVGNDQYGFLANLFNLPDPKTVNSYGNISVYAPDGLLFDTLHINRNNFENHIGANLPDDDWKRHGNLAWDSMSTKEKLEYSIHSQRIIGFADDSFDMDIIKAEMKERIKDQNVEQAIEETNQAVEQPAKKIVSSGVPMAKHFF